MINGGSGPSQNYRSHLLHVEQLLHLARAAGVPADHVAVFNADGGDPGADLAVREVNDDERLWLLQGTTLGGRLEAPVTYENSVLPGVTLEAATKENLGRWFTRARKRLRAGDTLFIYVTDHGSKNDKDTTDNSITLWGKEGLSVSELRAMLARFAPGVRVVAVMSQCFSGSFAYLAVSPTLGAPPAGNVCGYFASTAERPAYGCYPENRGRDNVGHAFHFLKALAETSTLPAAHARTLVADATPDVPITTSDIYLESILQRAAGGKDLSPLVDGLLHEVWSDKASWEPEIRLLDRVGHAFGLFSPRSVAELDRQTEGLPSASQTLRTYADAWGTADGDLAQVNLERFLKTSPAWASRLAQAPPAFDPAAARALGAELLGDLDPFTRQASDIEPRLRRLRDKATTAEAASYRMEVRLAVVLRLRTVLTDVAGRHYLATRGTPEERAGYEALRRCEDLRVAEAPIDLASDATPADPEPFPPYEQDLKLATEVLPAWMGIRFKPVPDKRRAKLDVGEGAATVVSVYPDSPAGAAGFQPGDVVLGPPGHPFTERNQIREWAMLSKVDAPAPLDVIRGESPRRLTLVPKPFPLKWPSMPGPPQTGSAAPRLAVVAYRGKPPARLATGRPHLLFFWATWCLPCKASLPEVLAFEAETKTQVVAITDEPAEQLDRFFQQFSHPFPETVALDENRSVFLAYGVSGTPTFVLVDGAGTVRGYANGYSPEHGLALQGWKWAKPALP